MAQRGQHVGGPAEPFLQRLAGLSDHLRVKAKTDHDHERVPVGRAGVQPPVGPGERGDQCRVDIQGQAEVAGEQVAGAERQDAQRDTAARDAVRAGKHQVDAVPHRLRRLAGAGVLGRGLQPDGLVPAVLGHGRADGVTQPGDVVVLGGVGHHRGPARAWRAGGVRRHGASISPSLPLVCLRRVLLLTPVLRWLLVRWLLLARWVLARWMLARWLLVQRRQRPQRMLDQRDQHVPA